MPEQMAPSVDLTTRIVLGTVQLGLPYGRRCDSPVMTETAAVQILDRAWAIGIRAFDTAEAYGSSAARLRAWCESRRHSSTIEIVTKCKVDDGPPSTTVLAERANAALGRFEGVESLLLLTHGFVGTANWSIVAETTDRRGASAGQSVYSAAEVRDAARMQGVARIQAPGNVLDRRALDARGDSPVRLDIRSIYLQGLLLDDPGFAEKRVSGSADCVAAVHAAASEVGVPVASLLVATMLSVAREGDRLVIGVDDSSELDILPEAFAISESVVNEFRNAVATLAAQGVPSFMLDPRTWSPSRAS